MDIDILYSKNTYICLLTIGAMFSKSCEYGIRASIFIAEQSNMGKKVSLKEVAEAIESPIAYTSKILQQLTRSQIIQSDKGPAGGFYMPKQGLSTVKLSTIVSAIDGDDIYKGCGLGLKQCNERKPCPVHNQFKVIRNELRKMLETTTIGALVVDYENGLTFLKR